LSNGIYYSRELNIPLMKPKFLLTIVALNTLFLATSIATASNISPAYNIFKLSQTISKLVGFDGDNPNLVESAIDRALKAKEKAVNLKINSDRRSEAMSLGASEPAPRESQKPTRSPIDRNEENIDR
jgi:hypothetical protein